jgi:cellulose synthase/poly-beta-1,6-N-acetylglucosamine synthase-like glycosyltransferase
MLTSMAEYFRIRDDLLIMTMPIEFPKIKVLAENSHQPFWSVIIPTYNGTKYLEETLKCVLVQDEGVDEMQIHVIDDCSSKDDPRELVECVGKGRVTFDWGLDFTEYIYASSGMFTTIYLVRDKTMDLEAEFLEVFISQKPDT